MKARQALRPQDILVALKLVSLDNQPWTQMKLARALGISQTEVAFSLGRLRSLRLLDQDKKTPRSGALFEFLVHGLQYVFPTETGTYTRGIATAAAAEPLSSKLRITAEQRMVWPHDKGTIRGQRLDPIYPTAPDAALEDKKLYELLGLVDAIRAGGTRERTLAKTELAKRMKVPQL